MNRASLNFHALNSLNDLNFGLEVVQAEEPVLVLFWTYGGMRENALLLAGEIVRGHAGPVRVYKVNVDENPFLAGHFHLEDAPALLLFLNGKVVDRRVVSRPRVDEPHLSAMS